MSIEQGRRVRLLDEASLLLLFFPCTVACTTVHVSHVLEVTYLAETGIFRTRAYLFRPFRGRGCLAFLAFGDL